MRNGILTLMAFLLVACGQPAWCGLLGLMASGGGLALFWVAVGERRAWERFGLGMLFMTLVHMVQMSWGLSPGIHGFIIIAVVGTISLCVGVAFGIVTACLPSVEREKPLVRYLGLAGLYTLLEIGQVHFRFCGGFNLMGMLLTESHYATQFASLMGAHGLTFWVMLTNLLFLDVIRRRSWVAWAVAVSTPYLFGAVTLQMGASPNGEPLKVLLTETARMPSEERPELLYREALERWEEVLGVIAEFEGREIDLLLLPETFVPYSAYLSLLPHEEIHALFEKQFEHPNMRLPTPPLAETYISQGSEKWAVSNVYITQAIADTLQCEVVAGFIDKREGETYNSAFHFVPNGTSDTIEIYDKQALVLAGEWVPFEWMVPIAQRYGLGASYTPGEEPGLFTLRNQKATVTICYEELLPYLVLRGAAEADLILNVSNDSWFPNSKLGEQHFSHARIRAVENGMPLIRAANVGVSAVVSERGESPYRAHSPDWKMQALYSEVIPRRVATGYQIWGDTLVTLLSIALVVVAIREKASST